MIHQLNVLVSLPVEVRVKPVPSCAVMDTSPGVPPVTLRQKKISAVPEHAVVATVTAPGVPAITPEVPAEALAPVGTIILLPAVPIARLPLVAVIAPKVAVSVVPAVMEVVASSAPACVSVKALLVPMLALLDMTKRSLALLSKPIVIVEAATPLTWNERYGSPPEAPPTAISTPPLDAPLVLSELVACTVTLAPASLLDAITLPVTRALPADTARLPVVTVSPVPAVTVVAADTDPRVEVMLPVDATILPVVAVKPVPAVIVVVDATVVVAVMDPGAVIAAGNVKVMVLAVPVVVIWLAVPRMSMLPPEGVITPPESAVRVSKLPELAAVTTQVAVPAVTSTKT